MRMVINQNNEILYIVSSPSPPQELRDGEFELEVTDRQLIDAFNEGHEILYNQATGQLYYQPKVEIDPEKLILYEAIANLFEEVQALKEQIGGAD